MFTVDTRKAHCQIRIMYAGPGVGPYHANELTDRIYLPRDRPIAVIKLTEHSDYSGSDVEASNYRVLSEAKDMGQLFEIYGSHGYKALAYDATLGPVPSSEELCEALEQLESYPLLDEEDHSNLELELESEAWNDSGREDFREALAALLDDVDAEYEHDVSVDTGLAQCTDEAIDALWQAGCNAYNVNGGSGFKVETGCVVYFYIDEWCTRAKREPLAVSIYAAKYGHEPVPSITELAELTRE